MPRVAHCRNGRTSRGRQFPRVGPAGTPARPSARVGPPVDDTRPRAPPRPPVTRLADPPSGRRRGEQWRGSWLAPPAALVWGAAHPRAASRRPRCAPRHVTRRRRGCRRHHICNEQLLDGEGAKGTAATPAGYRRSPADGAAEGPAKTTLRNSRSPFSNKLYTHKSHHREPKHEMPIPRGYNSLNSHASSSVNGVYPKSGADV